jgi:hypothetical protein
MIRPIRPGGAGKSTTGTPITYLLDGRQYLVVGGGCALYAFALPTQATSNVQHRIEHVQ